MKINYLLFVSIFFSLVISCHKKGKQDSERPLVPVGFEHIKIQDRFFAPRLKNHATVTLDACIDQISKKTARISNFEKAAGLKKGSHEGIYFDDSDVYKAMEGMAYSLVNNPNPKLESLMDYWVDLIALTAEKDGYVNTYYSLTGLDQRWTDMTKHEMYCGGHMIEAAIAYYIATGKRKFLEVAVGFADHIDSVFGPGKRHWVPGHQEIELALVKLYHITHEKRYLELAHWLLEERGHGFGRRFIWERDEWGAAYCQDDIPVSQISSISGHAVRAMYMFTEMADIAAEIPVPEYEQALDRVWEDVVYRNMYITGGIGSSGSNEGFTRDFDLPNESAYCETCASVGMVLWNQRMNNLSGDAKYIDILEKSLYNGAMAGISLQGDLFFYENPLESKGLHHRQEWYGCACCPSQISRFLPSIGNYLYSTRGKDIFINLYVASTAVIPVHENTLEIDQKTNYPWDGDITITVNPQKSSHFPVYLRVPGWCRKFEIKVNGKIIQSPEIQKGYLVLNRRWKADDEIHLFLDMTASLEAADPLVLANSGKQALVRGPLVYCMEYADNQNVNFDSIQISSDFAFTMIPGDDLQPGLIKINASNQNTGLVFIPYYAWDNREPGEMKVWIPYTHSR